MEKKSEDILVSEGKTERREGMKEGKRGRDRNTNGEMKE